MQAYKLKGNVNTAGNLVITESVKMPSGDVEVIVLLVDQTVTNSKVTETESQAQIPKRQTKIKALQNWFEKTQPASADFDPDQAKWEYLKEKHNL